MTRIAPSILSADFLHLGTEIKAAEEAGADMLHLDIMDGHFVPNMTIGPFVVEAIKKATSLPLDVHLMVQGPENCLKDFMDAGSDYLTVHVEASVHLHRTVHWIKENNIKAGVALNPGTPLGTLEAILPDLDMVVLMSVNPGFGGQSFIPASMEKLKALKAMIAKCAPEILIQVDGGVKPSNAAEIARAGADVLVMGSAFFGVQDYASLVKELRGLLGVG